MQILIIIILVLLNAFFAASEVAFISLNDIKIEKMANNGNKKAKTIKRMLNNPTKFLATIQIGITLAGFLSSAFASESFASKLAPILNSAIPQLSIETWNTISIILITIVLSYFTLIFGELVPKRIAMKYYEKIAFASAGIIKLIYILTAPFVKFLTFSTNLVSKLFGVSDKEEEVVTEEEIRMMLDVSEEKGAIEENEKQMINNIFEFNDKTVSAVMIPRREVFAVEKETSIFEMIDMLSDEKEYSRVPVYSENIDNIVGMVYVKDILLSMKYKDKKIKDLMKDAFFIPETMLIDDAFEALRKNRKQIAVVVDEYGGTSGIVTMEDILEEIVGEIYDEYDDFGEELKQIDENTFLASGNVSIIDIEELIGIKLEEGNYDTLSGYLVSKISKVPTKNDIGRIVETQNILFTIEQVKDKHILKVKIHRQ